MSWQPQPAHPLFPDCAIRCGYLFASKCRAGCPYCGVRDDVNNRLAEGARWWTDDEAVHAWQTTFNKYGPVLVDFTGMEATEELDLCGRILRIGHGGMFSTNLMASAEDIAAHIPADRAAFCTSFHPHLWGYRPEPFLEKIAAIRATGQRIISASVVGHPAFLPQIGPWLQAFRAADLDTTIHPFSGWWEGRQYPQAYTDEERATIDGLLGVEREKADYALNLAPPQIAACAAGWLYFAVLLDGTVKRCVGYPTTLEPGNFYRGELCLETAPAPCALSLCTCESLFQFHIPAGE